LDEKDGTILYCIGYGIFYCSFEQTKFGYVYTYNKQRTTNAILLFKIEQQIFIDLGKIE
jgi:hypothetical protein